MAYLDKADQKKAAHRHYVSNKTLVKSRAVSFKRFARERNRKHLRKHLSSNPCVDCGESDIVVLDFDHVRGNKISSLADSVNKAWSLRKIDEEIEKCEIRCANCHRRITHNRRLNKKPFKP